MKVKKIVYELKTFKKDVQNIFSKMAAVLIARRRQTKEHRERVFCMYVCMLQITAKHIIQTKAGMANRETVKCVQSMSSFLAMA